MDAAENKTGISAAILKNVAMVTMIIDHLTQLIWSHYVWDAGYLPGIARTVTIIGTSIIGRLAMPLFAFLLAEGAYYSRNRWKYLLCLVLSGIAAHIPYAFLVGGLPLNLKEMNIMYSLALALLTIMAIDKVKELWKKILIVACACAAAELLVLEYASPAILMTATAYYFRSDRRKQLWCSMAGFAVGVVINAICLKSLWMIRTEVPALLAFILISKYNGERGKQLPKWAYYVFYPAHLTVLALIRYFIP